MTHSVEITQGIRHEIDSFDGMQTPSDYVKTQLGKIVQKFRFDTIYDSMTGYPVGYITAREMRVMLDQVWQGELEPEMIRVLTEKIAPEMSDLIDSIESGVEQLRVRMFATMRPTPALAFQRDSLALERMRKADPQRILAYLLVRLFADNALERDGDSGLAAYLVRHELAVAIGRIIQNANDSPQMAAATRQLIELDARFNLVHVKMVGRRESEFDGLVAMLLDYESSKREENELSHLFSMIAAFARKLLAQEELESQEFRGNRAMQPAFVELTHDEVIAKITEDARKMQLKEDSQKAARELRKVKPGKIHITASMLVGLDASLADLMTPIK